MRHYITIIAPVTFEVPDASLWQSVKTIVDSSRSGEGACGGA